MVGMAGIMIMIIVVSVGIGRTGMYVCPVSWKLVIVIRAWGINYWRSVVVYLVVREEERERMRYDALTCREPLNIFGLACLL